jgi:WD40 repeat protein/serine/threonine protein kinase
MLNCPFCNAGLEKLDEFPEKCPECGRGLMDSGDPGARIQVRSDSVEPAEDEPSGTVESADSAQLPEAPATEAEVGDPHLSKTLISDEWENPALGLTLQSGELPGSSGDSGDFTVSDSGGGEGQTMISGESEGSDDPRMAGTIHSDEFALEDAVPDRDDQTALSDQWEGSGVQPTYLSDDLPQEAIKTMQTIWSGAMHGKTSPGMTIKGRSTGGDSTKSSLVIKQRSLASPGEIKTAGGGAPEYELIQVLGEGGMGVVYEARQMSVDRQVAIKMLKPKTAGDERQRQKFLAEAVVTGELDHPNIVPIYDVGSSARGLLFYSMKKVKGTPWMKLIQQKSIPENIDILMKVGDAVAFAHSRGVIHRDLKPENVMLGEFGEVLVMDWGLALPAPGYSKTDTISPSHSMGGTPAYMAPEMASGPLERITFASDVYLLGAILYEILTGRAPHTGKNTMQCLFAAAKNEIRVVDKKGELMDIALKAMSTDPKDRHATVRDFQAALQEYRLHIESIALATHAAEELQKAEASNDYATYARAVFGFEEALKQWDGNQRAKTGLSETRLKYATCAFRNGDYKQGLDLLDPANPEHQALHRQLKAAQRDRDARQQRLKTLKRALVGAAVLFVAGITVAFIWIKNERDRTEKERVKAVAAEKTATEEKEAAVKARAQEEIARGEAEKQKEKAIAEEEKAVEAEKLARSEEQKAKVAQAKAEEEQHKAELAKKQEEYEAYIAQIGLAAAKIDENAFGSARDILKECKPELRNWEWGRLMYLCGLEVRSVESDAPLDAVAFSADGTKFATGGWDHAARIWETATGKPLATLKHDGLYVHAVAFSPDGRFLATGGNDPRAPLRLWDAATGKPVAAGGFAGHTDAVVSVAFSRDGKRLLSASFDKTARLWDVESGKELKSFLGHSWWVWSAAFSPDEERVVTASQDGSAIIWRTETGARIAQFLEHRGPLYSAAFSPEGDRVVTGGYDKRVLVWRPADVRPFDFRKLAEGGARESVPHRAFEGHGAPVRSVSFSRDGALIVSGSHDNTVRVWDSASGRTVRTFRGHDSWVRSCAFSPDGRTVVSASHDHRATLWNITNYEEVRVLSGKILDGHKDAVLSASFNRDGNTIVTASRDRSAKTWDFVTGNEVKSFEEGHAFLASNAVFFPGGRQVLTSAVDNTTRFWDVTSGTQMARLDHTGRAAALALSADGTRILTGSDDKTAKLWDAENKKLIKALTGHKHEVTAVAFSPDGRWLFTGDSAGRGILWDAKSLEDTHHLTSHTGKITAAAFLPDSSRLLTASNDKTVAQWDPLQGKELLPKVLKHPDAVLSLALIPGGRQALTSCADRSVRIWDLETAGQLGTLPVKGDVNGIAVSSDGLRAITVNSEQRTVRLWELETRREILAPRGKDELGAFLDLNRSRGQLWTAIFSPESDAILTVGGTDARLWDMQKGAERMSFSLSGIVASAGFSPDGSRIVTGSWDNAARVWDVASGTAVMKLEGQHTGYVNTAVYSPDGSLILTASDDRTAVLWNAKTGAVVSVLSGHTDRVRSAVFSPDGTKILTASNDKTARLWNTATADEVGRFEGHVWAVLSAVFSADGTKLITGSEDNSAKIWDTATKKVLHSLEGHTASVASVAFLPDGKRVLTGSQDNTAKLWDADTGKEILTLKGHSEEVTCVAASTSGRYILTSSRDGTAVVWLSVDWTIPQTARR